VHAARHDCCAATTYPVPIKPSEATTDSGTDVSSADAHRDTAERLLADPAADTTAVLAAIAHAILAGQRPPLAYDAYNPTVTTSGDTQPS